MGAADGMDLHPVHPISWYLKHLDLSQYETKKDMFAAARQLREADVARRQVDIDFNKWMAGRQLHSKGERRQAVRDGRGRWCPSGFLGFGGCHGTGVIVGKGGIRMKCATCNGEGVRLKRKPRRSKARGKAWRP